MRMPVVLLSVLMLIFSSTPLFSQAVSFGRPSGFIRIEIQPNEEKLASTPFDSFSPSLASQIFGLTGGISENSGDQIKLWDAIRQAYVQAFLADGTGDSEKDGSWLDASLNPSGIILVPGVGFFIRNNHGTVQSAYLAGKLPLCNSRKTTLYPSLNLFSYPFASKIPINSSGISFFGNVGVRPDNIYLSITGPSYRLVEEDGIRKWINFKGNDSEIELKLGNAIWYENNRIANVISQDDSPYSNLFGKEDIPPSIASMALGQSKDEIILTINCTQVPGEVLEIFSKDLVENDVLSTGSGWLIAGQNIIPGGAAQIQWTDSGNLKPKARCWMKAGPE